MRVLSKALIGLASVLAVNALGEPRVITFPTSRDVDQEAGVNDILSSDDASAQTVFAPVHHTSNSFIIASKTHKHATSLLLDSNDDEAIHLAAQTFARDVCWITGIRPQLYNDTLPEEVEHAIVVGTVTSKLVQKGVKGVDYRELEGKWESYDVRVARYDGLKNALVIVGSDRVSRSAADL
jgi:hypothetical protein